MADAVEVLLRKHRVEFLHELPRQGAVTAEGLLDDEVVKSEGDMVEAPLDLADSRKASGGVAT